MMHSLDGPSLSTRNDFGANTGHIFRAGISNITKTALPESSHA
jgi:hypothetical protein